MSSTPTTLVWLFDVDGTLLRTEGAGREAIALGFRDEFGVEDDLADLPMAGRTDPLIVADVAARHGISLEPDGVRARLWRAILANAARLLTPARGGLLPGVAETLDAIAAEPGWVRALLTGNVGPMARLKLGAFGIADRFAFGAFGDEAPHRDALACVAVERARERYGVPAARCVVVGDTELDIACARAAGARVVAVATGARTRERLAAFSPDLLLEDLGAPRALLDWAKTLD